MATKRSAGSSLDLDPEYADIAQHQTKKQKTIEQDAKKATIKKIETIIKRQFSEEIANKDDEIMVLDEKIHQTRSMLDKLRACLAAKYYTSPNLTNNVSVKKGSSNPLPSIHPAVKKSLGKCPSNHPYLSQPVMPDTPDMSRSNSPAMILDLSRPEITKPEEEESKILNIKSSPPSTETEDDNKSLTEFDDHIRGARFKIKKRIIVGNVSRYIPIEKRDKNDRSTHKWMVYVRGPADSSNIEGFVKKVWFFLHPSYKPNDLVEISSYPFHLTRRGWGEFPIRVQLHFRDPRNKKVDIIHSLKLDKTYTGLQTLGAETVVDLELEKDAIEDIPIKLPTGTPNGTPVKTEPLAAVDKTELSCKLLEFDEDVTSLSGSASLPEAMSIEEYITKFGGFTFQHVDVTAKKTKGRGTRKSPKRTASPRKNDKNKVLSAAVNGEIVGPDSNNFKAEIAYVPTDEQVTIKEEPVDTYEVLKQAGNPPAALNSKKQKRKRSTSRGKCNGLLSEPATSEKEALHEIAAIKSEPPKPCPSSATVETGSNIQTLTCDINNTQGAAGVANGQKMVYIKCVDNQGKMFLLPQQFISQNNSTPALPIGSSLPSTSLNTSGQIICPKLDCAQVKLTPLGKQMKVAPPPSRAKKAANLKQLSSNRIRPPGAVSLLTNNISQSSNTADNTGAKTHITLPNNCVQNKSLISSSISTAFTAAAAAVGVPSAPNTTRITLPVGSVSSENSVTQTHSLLNKNSITLSLPTVAASSNNFTLTVPVAPTQQTNHVNPQLVRANIGGKMVFLQVNTSNSSNPLISPTLNKIVHKTSNKELNQTVGVAAISEVKMESLLNGPKKQRSILNNAHITSHSSKGSTLLIANSGATGSILKSCIIRNNVTKSTTPEKTITGWKAKRLAAANSKISHEVNRSPFFRDIKMETYPDMVSLLKAVVKQYPLISDETSRCHHPYCAMSRDVFLLWNIGKRRAAEWQRACDVKQRILSLLNGAKDFKGYKLWTTKAIVTWCRHHLFTPFTDMNGRKPESSENAINDAGTESDIYQISSCTGSVSLISRLETLRKNDCVNLFDKDVEIIDVIGMENPSESIPKIKVEIAAEKSSGDIVYDDLFYLTPTPEEQFIQDNLRKIGINVEPVEVDLGVQGHLVEHMLFAVMKEFASDLLRNTAEDVFRETGRCDEISPINLYKSIGRNKLFDFITNRELGKPLDDLSINLKPSNPSSR